MTPLADIKTAIWTKCNRNPVTVQLAADKAGVRLPITQVQEAQKLWDSLNKTKRAKPRSNLANESLARYNSAHVVWFKEKYPRTYADGHYLAPDPINTATSNGLTKFIVNYLTWVGYRATRISVEGRVLPDGTRIQSSTRKGTADISSTIAGRSCMWEVKTGKDRPSPEQLKEQARERKAGGEYLFTHTAEEFFEQLDKFLAVKQQGSIFG